MEEKVEKGLLLHRAYAFAALAHEGQKGKGSWLPYLVHPAEVAQILASAGALEDVICAGLLHDTLEDTAVTAEELETAFGCAGWWRDAARIKRSPGKSGNTIPLR